MLNVRTAKLPSGALLERYAGSGAYTDCFMITHDDNASLSEFISAFYSTPIFKLERWILARMLGLASTDQEAQLLAHGTLDRFSAWSVEARQPDQVLLASGRTRSWLMVSAQPSSRGTTLFFGSAIVPRDRAGLGWTFTSLLSFHQLYSRVLLASAAMRMRKRRAS